MFRSTAQLMLTMPLFIGLILADEEEGDPVLSESKGRYQDVVRRHGMSLLVASDTGQTGDTLQDGPSPEQLILDRMAQKKAEREAA